MFTITTDGENKLMDMLISIRSESHNYFGLHFHLSKLKAINSSEYQIKIVINIINDYFKKSSGGIFLCKDNDIIIIYRGENKTLIEKIIFQVRYLFADDPLAFIEEGKENPNFCSVYLLTFQWPHLANICNKKISQANDSRTPENQILDQKSDPTCLTPFLLEKIETKLPFLELSHLMRSQAIYAMPPGKEAKSLFYEIYVSIAHLRQTLNYEFNLAQNKQLFIYLTEKLDEYVLRTLRSRIAQYSTSPISININVATILSNEFTLFDAAVKSNPKASVVLEINIADVFADISAFMAAKQHVQKLGYRVCLDGLNNLSFIQVDRKSLGFDLAKLQWNSDHDINEKSSVNRDFVEAVQKCGSNRVILCRCDNEKAIEYGHSLGISLFQGWHFDKINNLNSK